MSNEYVLLVEKEEMWAKMLMQVLRDNEISCTALPVHGAGFIIQTGLQEQLRVYVPAESMAKASELLEMLFSAEAIPAEEADNE